MEILNEMAGELLAEHIRRIRAAFQKEHAEQKAELDAHVKQMDAVLRALPDAEREWLDQHLTDGLILAEDECTALYLAGLKDGLRLFKLL